MSHRLGFKTWFVLLAALGWATLAVAQEKPRVRELFVPYEDLQSVLEAAGQRVFLTRDEYEALLKEAAKTSDQPPPLPTALLDADYQVTVEEGRAQVIGKVRLEVAVDGLQVIPLELDQVGVKRALLDGQAAAMGAANGQTVLFVSGRGPHELLLEMVLPVEVTAACQTLRYRLPAAAAGRLHLTVPGDVELRSGTPVLQRTLDGTAGVTRFELLPTRGPTALEMTLNNRLAQRQHVVVARQVMVDELTETYERLHVTASMQVVHGAVEQFRFLAPAGFEFTQVTAAQLARWQVSQDGDRSILEVRLRGPETGSVLLQITAERLAPALAGWHMPQLQPLDVAGSVSVLGLLAEDRLRLNTLTPQGLIPIDAQTLTDRLPPGVLAAEPGAPTLRPLAAFYAPQPEYSLTADLEKPAGRLDVTSNLLLIVRSAGLDMLGGFALLPSHERIFGCQFSVEPGWEVTEVTRDNQPLPFERFAQADGTARIRVTLPNGVAPGERCSIHFRAAQTPVGWLQSWSTQDPSFPRFAVVDATTDRGAVAVQVDPADDLIVRPGETRGVTPLDDRKKSQYNLGDVPTALAYSYEAQPYAITLHIERKPPRITAETYSFLTIEPGNLVAKYEIFYRVVDAHTREVAFALPADTPAELTIRGLDGVELKEFSSREVVDGLRPWHVQLVRPADGTIHLAVEFQQRLDMSQATAAKGGRQLLEHLPLPLIRAADVEYQSGMVSVEGSPELEIDLTSPARKVDVGELVDAAYRPDANSRLLGAYGFVGPTTSLGARVMRPESYGVPAAVVQRGELVTAISAQGISQSAARFLLRTKAQFVQIQLPPQSELWSAMLDDEPSKPQHDGDRLLISLPTKPDSSVRDLRLVYETPTSPLGLRGNVVLDGPRLWLRDRDASTPTEVPLADLAWQVHVPAGFQLADSRGTVFPDLGDSVTQQRLAARQSPWTSVASTLLVSPGLLAARARATVGSEVQQASRRWSFLGGSDRRAASAPATAAAPATSESRDFESNLELTTVDPFADTDAAVDEQPHAAEPAKPDLAPQQQAGQQMAGVPITTAEGEQAEDRQRRVLDRLSRLRPEDRERLEGRLKSLERMMAGPGMREAIEREIQGLPLADETPLATSGPQAAEMVFGVPVSGSGMAGGQAGVPTGGVAAAARKPSEKPRGQAWALEGLRSLKIELLPNDEPLKFQSLGTDPLLDIRLIDERRIELLAWGVALLVLSIGLTLLRRPVATRAKYVAAVAIGATVLPLLLGGYHPWGATLDFALYAALLLIPVYLLAAVWRWLVPVVKAPPAAPVTTALILLLALNTLGSAQEQVAAPPAAPTGPMPVTLVDPDPPVQVPPDAILVPYDPETAAGGVPVVQQIIVPYEKYVELWNRAYPDKRLGQAAPPAEYAFAGGQWRATLLDEDFLRLEGQILLDLLVDQPVLIPVNLSGGVLEQALLNGQPARMQLVQAAPLPEASQAPAQQPAPPTGGLATLYASGKGRQSLSLVVRYRLERRGGWRVVAGQVPAMTANSLTLTVPQADTELRLTGVVDRALFETRAAGEQFETALAPDGQFRLEWRPKIAQATVDRSLTVNSDAVLDLQEDSLRLVWTLNLKFPLSQRDAFTIELPAGFAVEQVVGENVRGWEVQDGRLQVVLLQAARDAQSLTLHLSRHGAVGQGELAALEAPVVQVAEAVLHEGRLAVRRSPLLEVRVTDTVGLTRTDVAAAAENGHDRVDSPLGIRPFQAYRFARTPYRLALALTPLASRLSAEVQTLLRWSESERTLESGVRLRAEGRPVYAVSLMVPSDLTIDDVWLDRGAAEGPIKCQWSVAAAGPQQRLRVFFTQGQLGDFSLVLRGKLAPSGAAQTLSLPRITVDQVERQESALVVQTDSGFDARAEQLQGCQTVLLQQMDKWLQPEQRKLARLAIQCRSADYSGQLRLEKRTARVSCQTISNLAITTRTFETTILLDFLIEDAGIGQVSFLLPAELRNARISAPLVRQIMREETDNAARVRIRLQLQDENVIGQYRVLIEHDQQLTKEPHAVPVPVVEMGATTRRLVALETAGREEVVVKQQVGMDRLGREQQAWRMLSELLGDGITDAYLVQPNVAEPQLVVETKDRAVVETAGARILLAETVLTVDGSGAYRGVMVCRVDNRTEQFLEVTLPAGAQLWTAHVAGKPVKPVVAAKPAPATATATATATVDSPQRVRIPLIMTAEGDRDYPVELKYGGRMPPLGYYNQVDFPLIRSQTIQIEESQVRLWLPATHRWFNFDGTMRLATAEGDLLAGYVKYKTEQIRAATESLSSANPYTRLRAQSNLKELEKDVQRLNESARGAAPLQTELYSSLKEAQQQLGRQQPTLGQEFRFDNREQLDAFYRQQANGVGRNEVNAQALNFGRPLSEKAVAEQAATPEPPTQQQLGQIEDRWFDESGLTRSAEPNQPGSRVSDARETVRGRTSGLGAKGQAVEAQDATIEVPGIAAGEEIEKLKQAASEADQSKQNAAAQQAPSGKLQRFQRQLESESQLGYGGDRLTMDGQIVPPPTDQPVAAPQIPASAFAADGVIRGESLGNKPASGLTSLDVQMPTRGREYLFTTPRGDTQILARALDRPLSNRLLRLATLAVGLALAWFVWTQIRRWRGVAILSPTVCVVLIVASLILLALGIVPVLALAAFVLACGQLIRLAWIRGRQPAVA